MAFLAHVHRRLVRLMAFGAGLIEHVRVVRIGLGVLGQLLEFGVVAVAGEALVRRNGLGRRRFLMAGRTGHAALDMAVGKELVLSEGGSRAAIRPKHNALEICEPGMSSAYHRPQAAAPAPAA